jgi:hypothetical protein
MNHMLTTKYALCAGTVVLCLQKNGAWLDSEEVSGPDQIAMSVA